MGQDFSHDGLRMSYRGFSNLRRRLAREAGIPIDRMDGYGGDMSWDKIDDPLTPLLSSFDEYGGGRIPAGQCLAVKRRIEELADRWQGRNPEDVNVREWASRLARAIALAAFLGEPFEWF